MTNPIVSLDTTLGQIEIELDAEKAPVSTANFLSYVKSGHYDGTVFHRVIADFMIQGGGMTSDLRQKKTGNPIRNEATNGLTNDRGTVAMARTGVVDSATSQFFINVKDNLFLNHRDQTAAGFGYAVFGRVVAGMDVVDQIRLVPTTSRGGHSDVPSTPVEIRKATVKE